mmetsp:Transcript_72510/g.125803  ORF Transcript_72510/g.125803 Transcript_72510/m.125803 type:complete len:87 (+) Transcript_72510:40-300(+)
MYTSHMPMSHDRTDAVPTRQVSRSIVIVWFLDAVFLHMLQVALELPSVDDVLHFTLTIVLRQKPLPSPIYELNVNGCWGVIAEQLP